MNLTELRDKFSRAKKAAENLKAKADNALDKTFAAVEVAGAAGLVGAAEGYTGGDILVGGVPAEIVGAAALHGYAFLSGGKHADHIHNAGNGLLAVAAYKGAVKMGKKAKENKATKGSVFGAGELPEGSRSYASQPARAVSHVE